MITKSIEEEDVACQILTTYGWNTPMIDKHYDGSFSLIKFYTLQEAIKILKQNHL